LNRSFNDFGGVSAGAGAGAGMAAGAVGEDGLGDPSRFLSEPGTMVQATVVGLGRAVTTLCTEVRVSSVWGLLFSGFWKPMLTPPQIEGR